MGEVTTHSNPETVTTIEGTATPGVAGPPVPVLVGPMHRESVVEALLRSGADPRECLRAWAGCRIAPGERWTRQAVFDAIADDVAAIDRLLSRQLDVILHHERFQALEASWRGLKWLVAEADAAAGSESAAAAGGRSVQVKFLQCTKRELARDFEQASEFDRSAVWRNIYDEEFDTAGGAPFGLLVVDHTFGNHPVDIDCLGRLGEVAAASFAPLVAHPGPELLGAASFARLDGGPPADVYSGPEFVKWRALQGRDESRFIGLVVPRVLARQPYDGLIGPPDAPSEEERTWAKRSFRYREKVSDPDGRDRVWAGAAWAFAGVVVREFGNSGWFADIRGGSRGRIDGGMVSSLAVETFLPDDPDALRGPTDVIIPEEVERRLAAAGFIALCGVGGDGRAVFHSNPSIHARALIGSRESEANARVAGMIQYVLCASRIAHYLKALAKDKLGSFVDAEGLASLMDEWVQQYVTPDDNADSKTRAEYPLRAAKIEVREIGAGSYQMVMHLQPHFQIDDVAAAVVLRTKVTRPGAA